MFNSFSVLEAKDLERRFHFVEVVFDMSEYKIPILENANESNPRVGLGQTRKQLGKSGAPLTCARIVLNVIGLVYNGRGLRVAGLNPLEKLHYQFFFRHHEALFLLGAEFSFSGEKATESAAHEVRIMGSHNEL